MNRKCPARNMILQLPRSTLSPEILHLLQHHRLRGSGSTVVTMTSKVNRKTEILTPCRSETPEYIEAKLGVNDYVMDPYNLANFCGNRSAPPSLFTARC